MSENNAKTPAQESAFKAMIYPVIILVVICVVCSAALAALNDVTKPIIAANQEAATQAAYMGVLPGVTDASTLTTVENLQTAGVQGAVTTGIGSKTQNESFWSGFLGWDSSEHVSAGNPVDTIAGATVSSNAVISAYNSAIDCYNNEIKGVA